MNVLEILRDLTLGFSIRLPSILIWAFWLLDLMLSKLHHWHVWTLHVFVKEKYLNLIG